jgi:hypothetical protein
MPRPSSGKAALARLLGLATFALAPVAAAQIKEPGNHPDYRFELEPHLVAQYDRTPYYNDAGVGVGLRVAIPFVKNGPVPSINNNIGITFGMDFVYFGDDDGCRRLGGQPYFPDRCNGSNLWFPVTGQWNFFLTPVISVFGEFGLAVQYVHRGFTGVCPDGTTCTSHSNDLNPVEPVFWGGGRFLFGRTAGLTVRLGWPYISVGAAILF